MRGNDIFHVPVVLSYLVINQEECIWFVQEEILTEEQRTYLESNRITVRPYEAIYDYEADMKAEAVLFDEETINYRISRNLPESVKKITAKNPSERLKAIKNPVEIENTIQAHIKDGIAFTKFMYWLKTHIGTEPITELSAAEYLADRRKEQEHFLI